MQLNKDNHSFEILKIIFVPNGTASGGFIGSLSWEKPKGTLVPKIFIEQL